MPATSETRTYNKIVALALEKLAPVFEDQISTGNKAFYFYKRKGNWKSVSSGGQRYRVTLMYGLAPANPVGSYGVVNVNPPDGVTSGFFDWVQAAVPVSFSEMEEFQSGGPEAIKSIVEANTIQARASLEDLFSKSLVRGQANVDGTSFTTPLVSPVDGSSFIDPLGKLIDYAPSGSRTIGGINQSTNSWWQNQQSNSAATTLGAYLGELDLLHLKCGRGGGGNDAYPDFHIADEQSYLAYQRGLRLIARLPDYRKGDIPFANVAFHDAPVIAEELVGDVDNGSLTITDGTWYMCNSAYMGVAFDKGANFTSGDFVQPENQLVKTALLKWRGTHFVTNRRKLGVMGDIAVGTLLAATS